MYFPNILALLPAVDVRAATGLYVTQPDTDTQARVHPLKQRLSPFSFGGYL